MKNPKECACIRQKQTFFILNELTTPEYKDGSEPLLFHHDTFSRFNFVLINEDKKAATANVGVKAIPGIMRKIQNLYLKEMLSERTVKGESAKSPAYTTAISAGKLKGKTPAELLLENPQENKPLLIRQKAWLESNLAKYPRNNSQIEAIEEALRLYEEGKLHQEETGGGYHTEIVYSSGMRPLIRRKRADGKCFVYEITIRWNGGADRPVEIEIRNYYAPVIQKDSGLLNVMAKDKADEVRNTISLTTDQWFWIEHILETNIHTFESLCAAKNYKMALEEERKEKEMVKKGGKIAS